MISARKVVTTAGTKEVLQVANKYARKLVITAETDNTGVAVVGGTGVVAAVLTRTGTPLMAGDSVVFDRVSPSEIWVDVSVNGDGVTYNIMQ